MNSVLVNVSMVTRQVQKIHFLKAVLCDHPFVCAMLAQLIRSLTASQKVPGSIPGLSMGLNI